LGDAFSRHPAGRARHARDEKGRIAPVVETFAHAIDTTRRRGFAVNPLQILALADLIQPMAVFCQENEEICANWSRSARRSD
jgi:hypothetical protein